MGCIISREEENSMETMMNRSHGLSLVPSHKPTNPAPVTLPAVRVSFRTNCPPLWAFAGDKHLSLALDVSLGLAELSLGRHGFAAFSVLDISLSQVAEVLNELLGLALFQASDETTYFQEQRETYVHAKAEVSGVLVSLHEAADLAVASVVRSAPEPGLSVRQHQALEMLTRGLRDKEMASEMGISPQTVRNHLHALYAKLGVHNRRRAVDAGRVYGGNYYVGRERIR
jgi:DNA-binding CsgD family transcriptional regulator